MSHYDYSQDKVEVGSDTHDLLGLSVSHGARRISFTVIAKDFFWGWVELDTDQDAAPEFLWNSSRDDYLPSGVGLSGFYRKGATRWVELKPDCNWDDEYIETSTGETLRVTFTRSCLGGPRTVRARAEYVRTVSADLFMDRTRWTSRARRS